MSLDVQRKSADAKSKPAPRGAVATKAYAAESAQSKLAPFSLTRRDPLPRDVAIDILYCGVCHSDLHQARNEWQQHDLSVRPGS